MWQDYDSDNQQMVDKFIKAGVVYSKDVENAFRCVNRAAFVSKKLLSSAFNDSPIKGPPNIHMSAPQIYATIMEHLELEPGMSFLNIGSGTGYFSSVAGFLIKPHGLNNGIEINNDLVEFAREKVKDLFKYNEMAAKEICPPTFISGNCFLLDPSQIKYDRLYCGGSCTASNVTFFLEFLKIGGFLIAPLGNKLIKLERVSHKEGVKTVLSDVCFAPLARLDSKYISKMRDVRLPLLRFPLSNKRNNPKKTIFIDANFPVCKSAARKKLARLRAVQDALDSLERDCSIPQPFCYLPNLNQINDYNYLKKSHFTNNQLEQSSKGSFKNHLSTTVENPQLFKTFKPEAKNSNYTDLNDQKQSYNTIDIWNHLYSNKLWENVVDHYYSVCSTSPDRRDRCFQHKAVINETSKFKNLPQKPKHFALSLHKNITDKIAINNKIPAEKKDKTLLSEISYEKISNEINYDKISDEINGKNSDNILIAEIKKTLNDILTCICNDVNVYNNVMQSSPDKEKTLLKQNKTNKYINIDEDKEISTYLSKVSYCEWSHLHDLELISFLVENKKESESLMLKENLPKVFRSDIFEKNNFIKYPLLSNVNATLLIYRSISLIRVVTVIDSVLDILVGPSLKRDQFHIQYEEKFPLASFSEDSFKLVVSKTQINKNDEVSEKLLHEKACTDEEKDLFNEISMMMTSEIEYVKQQEAILKKKIELINNIDEQYKEQIKLLNQQVELIEEQQHLLVEVSLEDSSQFLSSQHLVAEKKQQRQALLDKRDKISADRVIQNLEKNELLIMLEQVLSLETKLHQEMSLLKLKGIGYLHSQVCGLSKFSQFAHKADQIISKMQSNSMVPKPEGYKYSHNNSETEINANSFTSTLNKNKFRYLPNKILPRCRFLLPLSKKRLTFVKEMLHSSERSAPQHIPVIFIDRSIPLSQRKTESDTVFKQLYYGVLQKQLNYRWNKKTYEQWWEVKFIGEGIIDQGGGFRDSLVEISEELCPPNPEVISPLPYFIKTPNQRSGSGNHLDCFTLNPSCDDFSLFYWIGQLMGACFRTDESLPLTLAPYIWKILVGEHVTWEKDYATVDEAAVRNIGWLESIDEDTYSELKIEEVFTTHLSNQVEFELCPNGLNKIVKWNDRKEFSLLVRKARMLENINQIKALRSGLTSVIPEGVLSCLTWCDLEKGVCGDPCISVEGLKANCRYGDDLKASSQNIIYMWSALQSFTEIERSCFIRFVTGRKRLPSPFIVSRSSMNIDNLPSASTCGKNLFLPDYSSAAVCTEKLRYAIYNCVAIDADTSPW
ncbi:uncharacterized protein LOC100214952 isoform X3 [Hydra vulgaris]|uniref:Uncharacterized protein LOC100214952 isoform X3 n=1 Tax=Hydra vulgaris TaxID=6087 RepID=A0ABM4CZE7_HYDVU